MWSKIIIAKNNLLNLEDFNMKKLLALLLSIVMMFSLVALPASASNETDCDINAEDVIDKIEEAETFLEQIYNFVHHIVHSFSEMFDFDCPFCDGKGDAGEPSEPSEPEVIVGTVTNEGDLTDALVAGGTYTVEEDITSDSFKVQEGTDVNFDLGENTITSPTIENKGNIAVVGGTLTTGGAVIDNYGNAIFDDVTIKSGDNGNYAVIGREGSYSEYNDVTIDSIIGGIGMTGGKAVFNGGRVEVNAATTSARYVFYVSGEGTELIINDGVFTFEKNQSMKRAYIYAEVGATVIVNGGNFGAPSTRSDYKAGIMGDGTIIIKGGTFGFDPSAWVAEGYTAVKDGSTWTVVAVA